MKNTEDISREDYISKLFRENEYKLEESPSESLFDRISSKLDDSPKNNYQEGGDLKVNNFKGSVILLKIIPYISVAAALLLLIFYLPSLKKIQNNQAVAERVVELEDITLPETSESLPIVESDKDSAFELKERIQKVKIMNEAKKVAERAGKKSEVSFEKMSIDNIEIIEKSDDLILITPEPVLADDKKSYIVPPSVELTVDLNSNKNNASNAPIVNRSEYLSSGKNFADPPVSISSKVEKSFSAELETAKSKKTERKKPIIKRRSFKTFNKLDLDARLNIFEWMIGNWIDEDEEGGISQESWKIINKNTIEGLGTKFIANNKIFEEKLLIYFDNALNQVFLKMTVDDYKKQVLYMLTSFDTERVIFEQREHDALPNKVIFQRNLSGFSTIIISEDGIMDPAQQAYFDQRNRVSNTKAIRMLIPTEN